MPIPEYYITLATLVGIYGIAALGLNITMGWAGQVNLGQAGFLGIGAMTSAILTAKLGLPVGLGIAAAALSALVVGAVMGLVSIRLREDFLAITTIAFNFLVVYIFEYYDVFGGSYGISNIPRPSIGGHELRGPSYMLLTWGILALLVLLALRIQRSWMGLAFNLVREDENLASAVGVDVRRMKVLAFAVGAMYGGVAGALSAHFKGYIVFSDFEFPYSIAILTMSILGGLDSIAGAILGSFIVVVSPEVFRPLMQYRRVMYGVLIVVVVFFAPRGLLGKNAVARRLLERMLAGYGLAPKGKKEGEGG